MKKLVAVLVLLLFAAGFAFAQIPDRQVADPEKETPLETEMIRIDKKS